ERKTRREASAATDSDDELTALERSRPGASSDAPARRETQRQLFLRALAFLAQFLLELGRRALRCVERAALRYVALVDRLMGRIVRGRGRRARLLAIVGLQLLALVAPLQLLRMQLGGSGSPHITGDRELSEVHIRPHILVERRDPTPAETKRRAFLRAGGDGLQTDDTSRHCENTVQGVAFVTDSMGYVCSRAQQDKSKRGCCNESDTTLPRIKQFACDECDASPPHCCAVFEHCVSCCMHPLNENLRREFLTHADPTHPVYGDASSLTVFRYCKFRCRTSSASVQHQNSYRSHRAFCYGIHRPLKVLPTVNSDGLADDWSGGGGGGSGLTLEEGAPLELDPFYVSE
ncbi:hypothetical protein PybrP1_010959, partial [[Pythium] brassicae (nom. inval.)]